MEKKKQFRYYVGTMENPLIVKASRYLVSVHGSSAATAPYTIYMITREMLFENEDELPLSSIKHVTEYIFHKNALGNKWARLEERFTQMVTWTIYHSGLYKINTEKETFTTVEPIIEIDDNEVASSLFG